MWKTLFFSRRGGVFYPQPNVESYCSFHSPCEGIFSPHFFHRLSFHISQPLWRKFGVEKALYCHCFLSAAYPFFVIANQ